MPLDSQGFLQLRHCKKYPFFTVTPAKVGGERRAAALTAERVADSCQFPMPEIKRRPSGFLQRPHRYRPEGQFPAVQDRAYSAATPSHSRSIVWRCAGPRGGAKWLGHESSMRWLT